MSLLINSFTAVDNDCLEQLSFRSKTKVTLMTLATLMALMFCRVHLESRTSRRVMTSRSRVGGVDL